MTNKQPKYNIFMAILSVITAMGLGCNMSMSVFDMAGDISGESSLFRFIYKFNLVMDSDRFRGLFIAIAVFFLLYQVQKLTDKATDIRIAAVSFVFALMQLVGVSYHDNNSGILLYLTEDRFVILRSFIFLVAYTVIWYIAIVLLIRGIELIGQNLNIQEGFVYKKYFIKVLVCLLICWLPYFILFFPGIGNGDTSRQLLMFFKERDLVLSHLMHAEVFADDIYVSNQHPYFTTLLYGFFVKIGMLITGKAYAGVALYCLVQMVSYALVFAYAMAEFCSFFGGENRATRYARYFLMFFPLIPIASISMIKDYTYAIGFVPLVVIVVKMLREEEKEPLLKTMIALALSSAFICLTRSQGPYVMLVIGAALFIKFLRSHRQKAVKLLISSVVPVILFFTLWSKVFLPVMHVAPAGKQEMLGIIFQQTARYVRDYPEDVTDEEKAAIDAVLKYDKLAELYDPELHDPVKHTYRNGISSEVLGDYFRVWFRMFTKHPLVYVEAVINNSSGAFWINMLKEQLFIERFINRVDEGHYLYIESVFTSANKDVELINNIEGALQRIPVISLFFSVSSYTLLSILAVLYLFRIKKGKYNIANLFVILAILCLFISPVNGHYRYVSSMMLLSPITFLLCIYAWWERKKNMILLRR